ncbi:putative dehydrogenase [Salana multivorans]|uniref:Putative dehydrogenase n=1 Tax=Salana multivorans TaxID=120377 RepID=A0A3N2D910_9MICO|nr:Gfo/Idh/MocA family oxidoreductase [Salana multivorans]ROR96276.1 putative dehydrogenase [Salana multivorans]
MTTRWGILGPGRIAAKVADDFAHVTDGVVTAVGSRSRERAERFVADHAPGARAYVGYRDLLADPEIDAVYLATPHTQHAAQAVAAIREGKAVLVEKTFAATLAGAQRVVGEATMREVFVMEAMWTRFLPAVAEARRLVADGAIGEVRAVAADLGINRPFDPEDRLFNLELGGGTLLDLGVYVVSMAQMVLGDAVSVTARGSLLPSGADAEAGLLVDFGSGRTATLQTSFRSPMPGDARIYGTEGWIDLPPRFHHPDRVVLHREGADPEERHVPPDGAGYSYEFVEVQRCLAAGLTQSPVMPLHDTLVVQRILQDAADQIGVRLTEADATASGVGASV